MADIRFRGNLEIAPNLATDVLDIGRDPAVPGSQRFRSVWAKEVHADSVYASNLIGDPDVDGSKNLSFTVNSDAVNGTAENAALVLKSSDGAATRSATFTMDAANLKVTLDRKLDVAGDVVSSGNVSGTWTGTAVSVAKGGTGATDAAAARTNLSAQALDATLTALAAYNTNGLLSQTAADTFAGRSVVGTANKIAVTNGDGVAGNPTIDIDAAYTGQASIVTLGTIATGTWNAGGATLGGPLNVKVVTQSATADVDDTASVVLANTGVGGITLTLPAVSGRTGRVYIFKKINADATALTLDGNGAETIDGAATFAACDAQYDTVTVVCDGDEWHIVSKIIA